MHKTIIAIGIAAALILLSFGGCVAIIDKF